MLKHKALFFLFVFISGGTAFAQVPKWKQAEAKGDTLYNQKDFKGAIKFYNKAIDANKFKDKDVYRTVYKRAVSHYSIGEFNEALKDLEVFIPQYPNVSQAQILKAFIYRELGDDENQLASLENALKLQPADAELLKWRGLLFLQKNDYEKSKNNMLLARMFQDDAETETYLGLSYYNLDQKDSSFTSFNKAIELDATYLPAYLYAGSVSLEDGNSSLALQYLNLALRLDPKNKEAIFYKGVALVELKKIDEGCSCLNRAFYAGMDEAAGYLTEYCYETEN
jgi:tetratricopeptide (TPR) repeat protein